MPRVRTHYDNLKVARDAPIEVIRAAYKSLSLKYHPDHHPGSERAARFMRIINTSYDVLSDPERKRQHDEWIAAEENASQWTPPTPEENPEFGEKPRPNPPRQESAPTEKIQPKTPWHRDWQPWVSAVIVGVMLIVAFIFSDAPKSAPAPAIDPSPPVQSFTTFAESLKPHYERPSLAPNGRPWPATSDYLDGYDMITGEGGLATLTIDNQQNSSDVFVKLYDRNLPRPFAVRWFFVQARDEFKITNLIGSTYDVRYKDLDSGVRLPPRLTQTVKTQFAVR